MTDATAEPSPYLRLPERDRHDAALDVAKYALHRILLGDPEPRRLAEKALADIDTLMGDNDR